MTKEPAQRPAAPDRLPVWTVEERVVFPLALSTLAFPLPAGKALLEEAHASGDYMAVCPAAKGGRVSTRTVGTVVLVLRLAPSDAAGVNLLLVQGVSRARLTLERRRGDVRFAQVEPLPDTLDPASRLTATAQMRGVLQRLDQLSGGGRGIPPETREFLSTIEEPGRLSDLVASQLDLPFDRAKRLLDTSDVVGRLTLLLTELSSEVEIQSLQDKLNRQTREEMDRRQKEYFLRQQLETIQAELSGGEAGESGEAGYRKRLESLDLPAPVREVLEKEISRLSRYGPFSEELSHLRAFLDLVFDLPWGKSTEDVLDLAAAQRNLDRDHYGLKKVKDRILEYMAVCKLRGGHTGTLFCFVGPPGVGKTSLGRAIARTLGRKFVRMSLGGVRDEAEIRGHRRTYIGAMPGRIIQGIKNAGSTNPVFVLDEVDKMGSDWRGDPSSALLEALDPEQNREFVDHYLGFPFDLSKVMFVATANTLDGIQPAFLDRLEILELPGYTEEEKFAIARRHLLAKQYAAQGLREDQVSLPDETLRLLIRRYTREAGVRNLDRSIEAVFRKVARKLAEGKTGPFEVDAKEIPRMLGVARFPEDFRLRRDLPGVATGLAWTETGGELLFVEVTATPGSNALTLTGQMGEVMRESAQAAHTYIKEHLGEWGLDPKALSKKDIHIHVPEGAIPKDGPSAGITIAVALLSTLTGRSVSRSLAFSGEITLRGEVLPVGGLREKLLAAKRTGIRTAILPYGNRPERRELPESIRRGMTLLYVKDVSEVFRHAFPGLRAGRSKRAPRAGSETSGRR
jgi:ATP-dependent Lon protease